MSTQPSQQFLKRRKLLLFLPLITLPFATLLFWALGGGKGGAQAATNVKSGLNTSLPGSQADSTTIDKLTLYEKALKDSLALLEQRKGDPYSLTDSMYGEGNLDDLYGGYGDPNEQKVGNKLDAFRNMLSQQPASYYSDPYADQYQREYENDQSLDQMKAMMQQMQQPAASGSGSDPELDKLDGMLQKIMDIQNPQQAKDRMQDLSRDKRGQVFSVSAGKQSNEADLLHSGNGSNQNVGAFYETSTDTDTQLATNKAVPAMVHETQTLVSGATIKMRLVEDIYINGVRIPKGGFVFATMNLDGERLKGDIKTIRYQDQLFPVSLAIYDMDGIEGIKVPGAISRDAAKQGLQQGVQSMDFYTMDPSIGAQAVSAGVQTVKSLFGNKAKLVRATVRAGYPILLMDTNKRNEQ